MGLIDFAYIVFLWGVSVLIIWRSYRKMGEAKRRQFIKELKKPLTIIGVLPFGIGMLLFFTGSASVPGLKIIQHLGVGLLFFGWLVVWVEELVKKEGYAAKSIAMIVIGVSLLIAYIYL